MRQQKAVPSARGVHGQTRNSCPVFQAAKWRWIDRIKDVKQERVASVAQVNVLESPLQIDFGRPAQCIFDRHTHHGITIGKHWDSPSKRQGPRVFVAAARYAVVAQRVHCFRRLADIRRRRGQSGQPTRRSADSL